ncbi:MAG: enoyl-[acyl-carrier-protein] reductase FabK [Chloroflexi bacterium]|nr:enoyl-[acyl-carrier-protein] reductase FabK [Chloroflexota bacterium]MBM3172158.1 enoyl-[acyl-carrier-protein] reductase FabK [Chloroflexota bacterium]MBM3174896.1 enoyl-[acyl-carrier-protein] reductase FabK [Chloroflexota bacterium]MBM4449331.1 enoyl-[acyl-carrier-protein] reductase FabK [Chloroflexota bacterium]
MKRSRLCDLLGIEFPIIQGGMVWIANVELATAVSNAGGLGLISHTAELDKSGNQVASLIQQIKKARSLTSKPFGINLPLQMPGIEDLIDTVIREQVDIVVTAAGNPATFTGRLKEAGIKVLHVVASVKHAQSAEKKGVDAVIAEGYEAGGHNGLDELTTFVLVPQVVDAVKVPVVAAGGIADARGIVAALALGADGVQMGTRFVATTECIAHQNFKEAIVKASDTDTVITGRKIGPTRILKNPVAEKLLKMEASGASAEEMNAFIGPESRSRLGQVEGDMVNGQGHCGAIAGMIKEIQSVSNVMQSIIKDYDAVVRSLV